MPWLLLIIAGILEVCWAIGLKYSVGFTKPWPSTITLLAMAASFFLLAKAVTTIPVGTAYAIWTAIGAVGTAILGVLLFAEPVTFTRVACIALIVMGVLGLKLASGS